MLSWLKIICHIRNSGKSYLTAHFSRGSSVPLTTFIALVQNMQFTNNIRYKSCLLLLPLILFYSDRPRLFKRFAGKFPPFCYFNYWRKIYSWLATALCCKKIQVHLKFGFTNLTYYLLVCTVTFELKRDLTFTKYR